MSETTFTIGLELGGADVAPEGLDRVVEDVMGRVRGASTLGATE